VEVKWRLARRQVVQYLVRQVVITRPLSMTHTLGAATDTDAEAKRLTRINGKR
jgi:hypothetical protein